MFTKVNRIALGLCAVLLATAISSSGQKEKPKGKEKEKPVLNLAIESIIAEGEQPNVVLELNGDPDAEEEEQGVTRCVCGNAGMLLSHPRSVVVLYDWRPSLRVDLSTGTRFLEIVAHWLDCPRGSLKTALSPPDRLPYENFPSQIVFPASSSVT